MYRFVDQRCEQIVDGSRFLLSAMRDWVISARLRRCPSATLEPLFSRMNLPDMLGDFHGWMFHLYRDTRLNLTFGCHCEQHILEDEALLLALWSDVACERLEEARALLGLLVHGPSVDAMIADMICIASRMSMQSLAPWGLASESISDAIGSRSTR